MKKRPKPTVSSPAEIPESFSDILFHRVEVSGKRKGERTRDRLKAETAKLLQQKSYRELRVTDINEAANVSNALFYVYFKDKEEIVAEILTEFLELLSRPTARPTQGRSIEEAIFLGNLNYIGQFRANTGLMHCMLQFGEEVPEFGGLWRRFSEQWVERMIRSLLRQGGFAFNDDNELAVATCALGSMVDGFLRVLFLDRDPGLTASVKALGDERTDLTLLLTRIWYRCLFAREMDWEGPSPD